MSKIKTLLIYISLSQVLFGCVIFDSRNYLENKKQNATETEKKMIDEAVSQLPPDSAIVLNPFVDKKSAEVVVEPVAPKLKYVNVIFSCEKKSLNDSFKYFANKEVQWFAKSKADSFKGKIFIDGSGTVQLPLDVYRLWSLKLNVAGVSEVIDMTASGVENKVNIFCPQED